MEDEFRITNKLDKKGNDSIVSLLFEVFLIIGIAWIVLFISPFLLGARNSSLRHDDSVKAFVLDLYNHPEKYYIYLTLISLICGVVYLTFQLKYKKIIEIILGQNQIQLIISNRLGYKFKRKSYNINDIQHVIKQTRYGEYQSIKFNHKGKDIGYYEFRDITRLSNNEKELIEKITSLKSC